MDRVLKVVKKSNSAAVRMIRLFWNPLAKARTSSLIVIVDLFVGLVRHRRVIIIARNRAFQEDVSALCSLRADS
jgi:hypothetical protein